MGKEKINTEKYRNAVLYFIARCDNKHLEDTKMNKLLYYLDFARFRDHKRSVTGDLYYHRDFGPTPQKASEIIASLARDKMISKKEILLEGGGHKTEYVSHAEPEMDIFTEEEKDLLEKICKTFRGYSAKKIMTQAHLEAPWFYSTVGEKINYEYANDIDIV